MSVHYRVFCVALLTRAAFLHLCLFFGDMSADIKNHRAGEAEFDVVVEKCINHCRVTLS